MNTEQKGKPEAKLRTAVLIILAIVVFQIIMDWSDFKAGLLGAFLH
ncbi:hypothetical protein SAMN04487907_1011017 [Zunongwangia mangrovi]|uniref:Uncharacterized protein n=1 Tax=Zunongwangia mangrovi TaxID=1334022 RepID=A0A1I1ESX7_9FLAO|nr:hypothetical protein [Zunongwangia mangrovi]SFB88003.1 hypothetical protein SAMN04487907_1011017 [Zunongwangia mangrovi]|tara:strand:+ start:331 stop:468 length:138 start_codon:yes stop_codon:yes gene_type:complete